MSIIDFAASDDKIQLHATITIVVIIFSIFSFKCNRPKISTSLPRAMSRKRNAVSRFRGSQGEKAETKD